MSKFNTCEDCILNTNYRLTNVSEQDKTKKYALILDKPDINEAILGQLFTGKAGIAISNLLKQNGFTLDDFYLTYAAKCNSSCSADTDKAARKCKQYLFDELDALPNLEIIITFGSIACSVISHRKKTMSKILNLPQELIINDRKVKHIATVHPDLVFRDPQALDRIAEGIDVFSNITYGDIKVPIPEVIKIETVEQFKEAMQDIYAADHVGFDVETTSNHKEGGLRIFDESFRILTVAFAVPNKSYWVNVSHIEGITHYDWARQLLNACKGKIVAHHRKFDVLASINYFNIHDFKGDDTLVIAFIQNENQKKGLKHLASKYLGWHEYDASVQEVINTMANKTKPNYEDVPLATLGYYNALDSAATLSLYTLLYPKLSEIEQSLYTFLMDIQNMFIECTMNGMPADIIYMANLKAELTKKQNDLYTSIVNHPSIIEVKPLINNIECKNIVTDNLMQNGIVTIKDKSKYEEYSLKDSPINLNSRYHLIAILSQLDMLPRDVTDTGMLSTSRVALTSLILGDDDYKKELIQQILEYKRLEKITSTFLKGLKNHIYPDGKIHPMFSLTTTVTGRTSASSPNPQQMPRDKEIKNIFYAPEGFKIVQYDFSQAEVRVIASFSEDPGLIKAITSGIDIHIAVASMMFDIPVEDIARDSQERQIAKSCSFGILYGTGPNNLAVMINSTKEDAANKIKLFMTKFPNIQSWIKDRHNFALSYGYVETPFGRKRRLPLIWSSDESTVSGAKRQAQNSPVQATASDLNLWLFLYIMNHMDKEKAIAMCTVHDSGVFLIHDSYVDTFIKLLKTSEEKLNTMFTFLKVPMVIDISVGQRWGSLKDYYSKDEEGGE